MESSAVQTQKDWLVNRVNAQAMTSPITFVSVIVSSRRPRGLWERLRPRTSDESRRTGSHIHDRLSLDKRCANLSRQILSVHRKEYRPSIWSVRNRMNDDSLILNHLHLVGSILEVGLRHKKVSDLDLLSLQNTHSLLSFSTSSS